MSELLEMAFRGLSDEEETEDGFGIEPAAPDAEPAETEEEI